MSDGLMLVGIGLLALMGAPLFAVILALAMLGFWAQGVDLSVIGVEMYRTTDTALLLAIPLFTFAGFVLSESRTSERLVAVCRALMGWMPAGLAVVALMACALFTAFTGASGVTIVALGALLYPALQHARYDAKFSLGLVTAGGSLGLLLPPALPLILYAIIASQSEAARGVTVESMFIAGLLPSAIMLGLLALYAVWANRNSQVERSAFRWKDVRQALLAARWEIPLPAVVLGGIYSGWIAVSEAAALSALYVLLIEVFVYREVKLNQLPRITADAMVMVGGILVILAVSLAFTNYLVDAEVPMQLLDWLNAHVHSPLLFLLMLNGFLLVLGAILDIFSAIIIVVPLLIPVGAAFGIHPVHLGIVFLANMQIGYLTPPVGMNLFIASLRFKKPLGEIVQVSLPFIGVLLLALALITYIPWLSLVFVE